MQEKTLIFNQEPIRYWRQPGKDHHPTLFFTHGLLCNHTMFQEQYDYFKGWSILTWDLPLHGVNKGYTDFSYVEMAEMMDQILQQENISQVILIAQSLGGFCAQIFAERFPQKVFGLAGIGIGPLGLQYYNSIDQWWLKNTGWMSSFLNPQDLRQSIALSATYSHQAHKKMLAMLENYQDHEILATTDIAFKTLLKENHNIQRQHPTLLILGEHDDLGKISQYTRQWHQEEGIPLKMVVDAGHNANMDNPMAVNRLLKEFILDLIYP
ncbi:alpha/beta hydrolase [Ignavigranum ruoffiae]|uniref:alpha/beta fold hydrolase n=1 Tax=Ignavigranum ruoffiae TaxID=89093 RepID=UPI0020562BA8|nr:alpha/beta fold hydrolase [Ignavigranum ruoffiae]UPQ86676.1 alpha/beta hydrolase [Ignavigranum ruoffiae]